jgi:transposase InsO family protein
VGTAAAKRSRIPVEMVFHDRDTKFTKWLDRDLRDAGIEVKKTAFRAPNTNAFVERFIQSIEQESLDHFLIVGEPPPVGFEPTASSRGFRPPDFPSSQRGLH